MVIGILVASVHPGQWTLNQVLDMMAGA
jgi:hypothetical protein